MSSATAGKLRVFKAHSDATARPLHLSRSGHGILLRSDPEGDCVLISAPNGEVEVTIKLTESGPVVTLGSASLELCATRDVAVTCDRFVVEARSAVTIASGGDLCQRAEGSAVLEVRDRAKIAARSVSVSATLGNVDLRANDDVVIDGERIYLNR